MMIEDFLLRQNSFKRFAKRYTEKTKDIVFFVGAGASQNINLPAWDGLIDALRTEITGSAHFSDQPAHYKEILDRINSPNTSNWDRMDILKNSLGPSIFKSSIENILSTDKENPVYKNIIDLNVRGICTLNLDMSLENTIKNYIETAVEPNRLYSYTSGNHAKATRTGDLFLSYLHGRIDQYETWVLTLEDSEKLSHTASYKQYLRELFSQFTIVFYGVTVSDFSASGQLRYLRDVNYDIGEHYWILREHHIADINLSKEIGAQIIGLPTQMTWELGFNEFCKIILKHKSTDQEAKPIISFSSHMDENYISPKDLISKDTNNIRVYLNNKANEFIRAGSLDFDRYEAFCEEYKRALRISTEIEFDKSEDKWMNSIITGKIGEGIFGEVYSGRLSIDIKSQPIALKIARDSVRRDRLMLNNFRRGVSSMRILTDDNIQGVPRIIDASELPPYIIMEYIDGIDLQKYVFDGWLTSTRTALSILIQISEIISRCHKHELGILHRDLRPSNVIVSGDYWDTDVDVNVTVLDFDLSWHIGASTEEYIMTSTNMIGYLAPEQLLSATENSRNAKVDVYGIGMLIYFCLTGRHPIAHASVSEEWSRNIINEIRTGRVANLSCTSMVLQHLIISCVAKSQEDRPSLDVIINKLKSLLRSGSEISLKEIACFEIFQRSFGNSFKYDSRRRFFSSQTPSGAVVECSFNESEAGIKITINYTIKGDKTRKNIGKFLNSLPDFWKKQTKSPSFLDSSSTIRLGQATIYCVSKAETIDDCKETSNAIRAILNQLSR